MFYTNEDPSNEDIEEMNRINRLQDELEEKKDKKEEIKVTELNLDALEKASAGYRYNGPKNKWLHDEYIRCPNCGYGIEAYIRDFHLANYDKELFYCYICNQTFMYELTDEGITSKMIPKK